ncbi:DNA-binding protein [Streptococcus pneumoniae]|nr:DNA-binding protein [Streptococcus pneumoniae]CIP81877.1 DNA-binding protein [Streptococcus pneumoniae]CIS12786.1 DNA-binding protein [Streptococcus pneumoniae]CIT06099.1 DNA-binding protein [Streptococcus pneumoniae]CIV03572.1 DNA-binding protein [Streptococcus pneumoniae]
MKVFDGAKMRAIRKEAELTQYDLAPMDLKLRKISIRLHKRKCYRHFKLV